MLAVGTMVIIGVIILNISLVVDGCLRVTTSNVLTCTRVLHKIWYPVSAYL
jgi:hypothetical protein